MLFHERSTVYGIQYPVFRIFLQLPVAILVPDIRLEFEIRIHVRGEQLESESFKFQVVRRTPFHLPYHEISTRRGIIMLSVF